MKRSSILDLIGCFRRIYRVGRDLRLVTVDLPKLPRNFLPEDARPPRQLTEEEVRRLLAGALQAQGPAFERLLRFMAWCPRRPVAIFALRRAHCARVLDSRYKRRDKRIFVERDKGGYGRGWCPLTEPALLALEEQLRVIASDDDALVWPAPEGGALDTSNLNPRVDIAAELAGLLDVQPYDLRKFGASQVYASTRDIKQTQAYTGHKEAQTLIKRYLYDVPGLADVAASAIGWSAPQLRLVAGAEGEESER